MSKIILITHQKGGVGKSTLAFNLAQNLSKSSTVAIVDLDLQGSLSQLNGLVTDFDIIPFTDDTAAIPELDYDFIFVDTPPYLSNQLPQLIQLADLIVVPTKAGILDLLAIKSTLELIEKENGSDRAMVVFNMVKANTTLTLDILIGLEEYNIPIAKTHISDLVAFTRSVLLNGVDNDRNAKKQLDRLTEEIITKLV
ncbi:ParA family protein [Galbibacter mesophilus]|uniref:ParA family protein n=1 Tax=Galbibacter mesophilus TaxID=379069 RepID=UPI00191E9A74|nr:ParA family protein [Galbibacter mesophilus]MCM5664274.1 ParA family protein [Galbibacter mesophilus]